MVDMERDFVEYLSEGVKIVKHRELGLVMFLRKGGEASIQRALATTGYRISGKKKKSEGTYYYSLEEENNGSKN